jgi:hypothetical protein
MKGIISLVNIENLFQWDWQISGKYSYFPGRQEILVFTGKYWEIRLIPVSKTGSFSISSLRTLRNEIQIGSLTNHIECFRTYCTLFNITTIHEIVGKKIYECFIFIEAVPIST